LKQKNDIVDRKGTKSSAKKNITAKLALDL
jgi:hypothetical protein